MLFMLKFFFCKMAMYLVITWNIGLWLFCFVFRSTIETS